MSLPVLFFVAALTWFFQNVSFTWVSRARNSSSLSRHMKAAAGSNLIWFFSQVLMLGPILDMMKGSNGYWWAAATAVWYTAWTMTGSAAAHYYALRTEKGKSAVGSSRMYAQIPVEEWERIRHHVSMQLAQVPKENHAVQKQTTT
jgi:hypothetical protein